MLSKEVNDLLTQTGADAPMGQMFRKYWIPALLANELPENDSPPVRVKLLGERVTVIRPPAVYGPGDRETLVFFQMARKLFVPLAGSPEARAAMIHVDYLCTLLVAQLRQRPGGRVLTASDDRPQGYTWREVFGTAARAVGNPRARLFHAPAALLHTIAMTGNVARLFGRASMLTSEKLRELRRLNHQDD